MARSRQPMVDCSPASGRSIESKEPAWYAQPVSRRPIVACERMRRAHQQFTDQPTSRINTLIDGGSRADGARPIERARPDATRDPPVAPDAYSVHSGAEARELATAGVIVDR